MSRIRMSSKSKEDDEVLALLMAALMAPALLPLQAELSC